MKRREIGLIICLFLLFVSCQQKAEKVEDITEVIDTIQIPTQNKSDSLDSIKQVLSLNAKRATDECSVDFLIEIRNNIGQLSYQQTLSFLEHFNEICELNVEYSEFNNYLLFSVLRSQPGLLLKVITENNTIKYQYIKKNLTNPINDTINLNDIYRNVNTVNDYEEIKDSILLSLKIAIENLK